MSLIPHPHIRSTMATSHKMQHLGQNNAFRCTTRRDSALHIMACTATSNGAGRATLYLPILVPFNEGDAFIRYPLELLRLLQLN